LNIAKEFIKVATIILQVIIKIKKKSRSREILDVLAAFFASDDLLCTKIYNVIDYDRFEKLLILNSSLISVRRDCHYH